MKLTECMASQKGSSSSDLACRSGYFVYSVGTPGVRQDAVATTVCVCARGRVVGGVVPSQLRFSPSCLRRGPTKGPILVRVSRDVEEGGEEA